MAQGASLLLAMGLWLAVSSVWAGSFQVSPIRLQLSLRERATALHLANTGDTALVLHAEVMHWSQDTQGQDLLEPSNDLVLSPPVVNLPPGGQQVVRLARLNPDNTHCRPRSTASGRVLTVGLRDGQSVDFPVQRTE
jgi:fimbrial chaperone protein